MIKRIAISTGGGDAPGLNAVIRSVTLTAINEHGWNVVGLRNGFDGALADEEPIPLTRERVHDILDHGGTILGAANRGNPFRRPVQQPDGSYIYEDVSDRIIEYLEKHQIDALVMAGGDGTMKIAYDFLQKGVQVVGVPKTIDNDLGGTDVTFGFDTALNVATDALDRLHTTAESHHRVMLLEVMGRHAGWIALHAGVAGGADVILIPEIPFKLESICNKVTEIRQAGRLHSLIIVAEGAAPVDGDQMFYLQDPSMSEGRLGGIAQWVGIEIAKCVNAETRVTVLGHIQRGGRPTAFDRWMATRFGAHAVRLIAGEKWGYLVGLHAATMVETRIEDAIAQLKQVNPDSEPIRTARGLGISFGAP